MTDKRIFYTRPDGGLSIVVPINDDPAMVAKAIPDDAVDVFEGTTADVPRDRTFRDAWVQGVDKKPKTDMPKAKLIAHEMRREQRDKEFKPLDVKATIPNEATKAESDRALIRTKDAKKQVDIDRASTEAELKQVLFPVKSTVGVIK